MRFHEILFQTDDLGRSQYQNKKALFTDPIFSDGFGFYNIGVGVPHCPIARILGPRKNRATQNSYYSYLKKTIKVNQLIEKCVLVGDFLIFNIKYAQWMSRNFC